MTSRSMVTVRCVASSPARLRWYRSLAYAISATAESGAVFEATGTDPVPWVTVRPGSLIDLLPTSGSSLEIRRGPDGEREFPEPRRRWVEAIRSLVSPFPRVPSPAYRSEIGRDFARLSPGPSVVERVRFQTHWIRGRTGEIWVCRRFRYATQSRREFDARLERVGSIVAEDWAFRTGLVATAGPAPLGATRDWRRGTVRAVPREAWLTFSIESVPRTAEAPATPDRTEGSGTEGHEVVFGASGAGKTTYLAERAAREMTAGSAVVAIDLHGDLGPAILARVSEPIRSRVIVVDALDRPVPGIAILSGSGPDDDAAAAHLVAALKRLSPDGTDLYWGFRLERVFDSFVRLAQESGGTLLDLYDLLTDPTRRDVARLATRRPDLARFLDELAPIVRRQPEFLWSAATRLAKVVLVPGLTELLAPADGGLPVEELLDARRSIVVRLPFASLGPEAATFAGSLILTRIYLGLAARRDTRDGGPPVVFVIDEAHGFSPRLTAELLTESRKFGIRIVLATQFPDRLAPEVRSAAAGAPSEFVTFRVPPATAGSTGEWVGLPREEGERWLPSLPTGSAVRVNPEIGIARPFAVSGPSVALDSSSWARAVARTRQEFPFAFRPCSRQPYEDEATERLLLAVLAAEEAGRPVGPSQVVPSALSLPGRSPPAEVLGNRWNDLLGQHLLRVAPDGCHLTEAGERRLGLTSPTGAAREGAEHRGLLLATFRLFARRGYRIEIVRQGRFDTTLPDARLRQLASPPGTPPADLAAELDRVRRGWAWSFFGGRDVHIEVEVSGALRSERIRRGWRKASNRGAFALFVVGDPARARKIRSTLRNLSVGLDRAQVWTLRLPARPAVPLPGSRLPNG